MLYANCTQSRVRGKLVETKLGSPIKGLVKLKNTSPVEKA